MNLQERAQQVQLGMTSFTGPQLSQALYWLFPDTQPDSPFAGSVAVFVHEIADLSVPLWSIIPGDTC